MGDDLFYLSSTIRLFPLISNVFLGVATLVVQYSAASQQGMGTKGTHWSAAAGIVLKLCQGCVQRCPLFNSRSVNVNSSRCRGRGADKHPQAVRRDGVGLWPCASCAVWYGKEGIWHHHMTKWPQFYSVLPSAEPNRSGHKKHSLCQEACPALWTKFVTANKFWMCGAWWCDLVKLLGMVLPEKQNGLLLDRFLLSVSDLPVSLWALWCYCFCLRWCFYIELKQLCTLNHSSPQAWTVGRGGTCHCSHRAECSCSCGLGSWPLAHVVGKKHMAKPTM